MFTYKIQLHAHDGCHAHIMLNPQILFFCQVTVFLDSPVSNCCPWATCFLFLNCVFSLVSGCLLDILGDIYSVNDFSIIKHNILLNPLIYSK